MKNFLSIAALLLFTKAGISQNNKIVQYNYIFSADSLAGFDEVAAKNSAVSEGFLGEEFKVRMWSLKRSYVNSKYGITPEIHKYKNSSYNLRPSSAAVCVNEDFEASAPGMITTANQIAGWTLSSGLNQFPSTSCNMTTTGAPAESELISASGYIDPVIGAVYPIYSVFGTGSNSGNTVNPGITNMYGSKFLRLNSNINNYSIEKISKTIVVTPANCLFQFAFITVFSTGHTCCDAGAMKINLINATTSSPITCPNFTISAPSSACASSTDAPAYYNTQSGTPATTASALVFNKWKIGSVDLSAYMGQNITIEMLASDCTAGGHYGYAYIDAQCSPMAITFNNNPVSAANPAVTFPTCGATTFTITAPPGLGPYSWAGVGVNPPYNTPAFTNQTFTTNFAGTYTLIMNPIGSCAPLTKVVTLSVSPSPSPLSITGNTAICSAAASTLTVNGASTYTWSTGSNSNSIVLSPPVTTSYAVSGTDINGCTTSANFTVNVGPINLTVSGSNIVCSGSSATFTLNGASSYSLNSVACATTINILPTATTNYTISGSNSPSCVSTQTFNVFVNSNCADVWPGDANSDGVTNNLDILELGLHLTQTGPPRASTSNLWQSYFANNWIGFISNGKNLCHSNCNGDGIIDLNDTLAIYNNYNLTHSFKSNSESIINPQLVIIPDQSFVASGNWGTASIYLGDASNSISNLNGAAFNITFFNTFPIANDSVYVDFPVSFLNASNQNLHFRKKQYNNGVINVATTHTNNINVNGDGKIAVFHFKVDPGFQGYDQFHFGLSLAYKSDANGIVTPLTIGVDTITNVGIPNGLRENNLENTIYLFPNPTKGSVTIKSNSEIKKVEVITIAGQILVTENAKGNSHQLNLESFAKGIYFVKIYNVSGQVGMKKVVTED